MARISEWLMRTAPPAHAPALHAGLFTFPSSLVGGGQASSEPARGQVLPQPSELRGSMSRGALPEGHSLPCSLRGLPALSGDGQGASWRRDRTGKSHERPSGSIWQLSSQDSRLGFSNPERAMQPTRLAGARVPQRAAQRQSCQTWWRGKACGTGDMPQGAPQAQRERRREDTEWSDLTRRASSREGAEHVRARKTRRSSELLLNLCEIYAERRHRSASEQDWTGGHWDCGALFARQQANGEVHLAGLGAKREAAEERTKLQGILTGGNNAVKLEISADYVPSYFVKKPCLGARCSPVKKSPNWGRFTSLNFLEELRMQANDMAAVRKKKKEEVRAQKEQAQARKLLGWQDEAAALKKATQERQLERSRVAQEKRSQMAEAGASMEKLESSLDLMQLQEHEVTGKKLELTIEALSKAGVPNTLKGRNGMEVLGIHLDAAAVCARGEEIATGEKGVIQAVSMHGAGIRDTGKLFLVVSEVDPGNQLSRDTVMTFMRGVNMSHISAADIEGVTKTMRHGARDTAVPNIFEISLKLSEPLTAELLMAIRRRRTTIADIACTLALETSYSLNLTFGNGDRKKLGAMWKIMRAFNMDQDQFCLVVAAAARKALALRSDSPEMGASLVGVALQRQIGPKDNKTRLSIGDIADARGPNFRVMFSRGGAPNAFPDLIVPIGFGQGEGPGSSLIWLEGIAQQHLNEGRESGLEAAKERVQKRGKVIVQEAEHVLSMVEDIARAELEEVADEENAGAWSTGNFTKILSAITSLSVFDVTADFVKGELMQVLQMPGKHEELCQSMLTVAQELKVEVKRRRQLLSNLMIIKLAPFPKLEEIYMEMGKLKSDIRTMNENATPAMETWLRTLKLSQGATLSFLAAELVVTRGKPGWDNTAGIVVACQAAQQLSGGLSVFQKAENAAGGAAGWKNMEVRQAAREEKIATKIKIQVMVGKKKPGASEQIRTKDQEVCIYMVEEEGSTLFAEKEREAEKTLLMQYAREGKGVWVPEKWTMNEDEDQPTVLSGAAGLPITKLSSLPDFPGLPFYIRNIASGLGREKAEDCDGALGALGELRDNGEILPVKYDENWVVYLHPALAREIHAGEVAAEEQMSDGEDTGFLYFVELGADTSEAIWAFAQEQLAACIKREAGEGVWIDWFPTGGPYDISWQSVKLQSEVVQKGTKGARWIGDICECAIVEMARKHDDNALLRSSTEKVLGDYGSLRVFKGSAEVGLILYGNTIRTKQLRTEAVMAGSILPAVELTSEVVSKFETACRKAAAAGGTIALVTRGEDPLSQVRAEWSEAWRKLPETEKKLLTVVEAVEEEWTEQMTGTSAAAMFQEMETRGTAVSFKTDQAYIIIFPEEVTSRGGITKGATFQDQFGKTGKEVTTHVTKRLRNMEKKTGREKGLMIQSIVQELSKERLSNEIDEALNAGPCVISGASITGTGNNASLQAESGEEAMSDADLRQTIKHPGAQDTHFLREVAEGILNNDVRCEAVNGGKSVLLLPADPAKKWNFSEWQIGDPRFRLWTPLGEGALAMLSNMPSPAGEKTDASGGKAASGKEKRTIDQQKKAEQEAANDGDDLAVQDRDEGETRGISRTKAGGHE